VFSLVSRVTRDMFSLRARTLIEVLATLTAGWHKLMKSGELLFPV
jgi:hypothetical protein